MIAIKDARMTNLWSFKSSNIYFIFSGCKLNIKKKIIKYQPQNFARKIDIFSIVLNFYSCNTKNGISV